jgi:hypothetical protein
MGTMGEALVDAFTGTIAKGGKYIGGCDVTVPWNKELPADNLVVNVKLDNVLVLLSNYHFVGEWH